MKQLLKYRGVVELLDEGNHALNQAECPHCKRRSPHGYYNPETDPDAFIGWCECRILPKWLLATCDMDKFRIFFSEYITFVFKCPNCLRLFWLHNYRSQLTKYNQAASEGRLDPRIVEDADEKDSCES